MNVESIPASELSADLVARWEHILQSAPQFCSPYFRPEYVQTVAGIRAGVEIGLLRNGSDIVGFFPFERHQRVVARPVGGRLSDYQGVVAAADVPWKVSEIMIGCGLKAWEFDHQLACQEQLSPFFIERAQSRYMDLASGYETYLQRRRAETSTLIETLRKFRKFQREHNVRFVWNSTDEAALSQLAAWKAEQYARTRLDNLFAIDWVVKMLRAIRQRQSPQFSGVLCAMYANDKLAAVHFCMQSGKVLHSWFPAYDVGLAKFSPGACLLLLMAQHAGEHGVTSIDLGKGDEEYKLMFGSASVELAEGVVETRPLASAFRRGWRQARDWVKQTPLKEPARASLRWLRNVQHWWKVPS
jgi:CelD/BcsL family acetyltransferase involved in cellulose biosynthesis